MADAHHDPHYDPNAAPMRQEVRFDFPALYVVTAGFLGVVALTAGAILGIVLAND